jgi:thiol-disulfide isomerase/thioredoxin
MKKIIKQSSLFLLIIIIEAFVYQPGYTIRGNVTNIKDGTLYLKKKQNEKLIVIDSTGIVSGKFLFKGYVELPEIFTIVKEDGKSFPPIFVENADITITADSDSLKNAIITGSKSHDIFNEYKIYVNNIYAEYSKLNELISTADAENEEEKVKTLENEKDSLINGYMNYTLDYVVENKNSVVGAYILLWQRAKGLTVSKLDSLISMFDPSIGKSVYIKSLNDILTDKMKFEIGGTPPDFTLNDKNGIPVAMSSFRGKYLMIDFWSSWCTPCRKETPYVLQAYKKYHSKGFEVLSVSLDGKSEDWQKAIEKDKMEWNHLCDFKNFDGEVAKLYYVSSIPKTFLLDKEGCIIAKDLRGDELSKKLAEIFGEY